MKWPEPPERFVDVIVILWLVEVIVILRVVDIIFKPFSR